MHQSPFTSVVGVFHQYFIVTRCYKCFALSMPFDFAWAFNVRYPKILSFCLYPSWCYHYFKWEKRRPKFIYVTIVFSSGCNFFLNSIVSPLVFHTAICASDIDFLSGVGNTAFPLHSEIWGSTCFQMCSESWRVHSDLPTSISCRLQLWLQLCWGSKRGSCWLAAPWADCSRAVLWAGTEDFYFTWQTLAWGSKRSS